MYRVRCFLQNLAECGPAKSEAGVTAIEYALIAAITMLGIVAVVMAVGLSLSSFFSNLAGRLPT